MGANETKKEHKKYSIEYTPTESLEIEKEYESKESTQKELEDSCPKKRRRHKESINTTSAPENESNSKPNAEEDISSSIENSTNSKTIKNPKILDNKKIPFVFEWNYGGKDVKMTAQFLKNWGTYVKLIKNYETGVYEYKTFLPKGIYEFVFKVDGVIMCSDMYPKIKNENNIINYIDLTKASENDDNSNNYSNNYNNINEISNEDREMQRQLEEIERIKKEKEKEELYIKKMASEYGEYFPNKHYFHEIAPKVPFHYITPFNIDNLTNQPKLKSGKKEYLNYIENNLLSENNSFKKTLRLPHVNLNHICTSSLVVNNKETCVKAGISENRKHKVLSIVYYVPTKRIMKRGTRLSFDIKDNSQNEQE